MEALELYFPDNVLEINLKDWFKYDHISHEKGLALLIGVIPDSDVISELKSYDVRIPERGLLFSGIGFLNGELIQPKPTDSAIADADDANEWLDGSASPWDFCQPEEIDLAVYAAHRKLGNYSMKYKRILDIWNSGRHPGITPLGYFIEWAKSKDEAPSWLSAAESLGLIGVSIGINETPKTRIPTDNTLLKTIAALLAGYPPGKEPSGKDLERAAQSVGVSVTDDAIRKAIKAAKEIGSFPA